MRHSASMSQNFQDVYPEMSNQQYFSIGSDYGLAPTRRQTIISTNDVKFTDALFGLNKLMQIMNIEWIFSMWRSIFR